MRRRWIPLWAAILLLLLVAAGSSQRAMETPVPRQLSAAPPDGAAGSMSYPAEAPAPSLAAADISRAPAMSRPETPQTSRLLTTALVGIALLMAASTRRRHGVRRRLELSISSKSDWWRPIPGGRAPPDASTR